MRRPLAWLLMALLLLAAAGCSGAVDRPRRRAGETTGPADEGTGQATRPGPSLDEPGGVVQGRVGEAASVGGWTVLVREAEYERPDDSRAGEDGGIPPGIDDNGNDVLKIEIDLRHGGPSQRRVSTAEWTLLDPRGEVYAPRPLSEPEKRGERTIDRGEIEDVTVSFDVSAGSGAFILRFAPSSAGGTSLNIAIP